MPHRSASHRLLIANLLAQICFGLLAMTVCLPSMRAWGVRYGSSQAAVQLTFSAYVGCYGTLQLVYGPLSDRYGRRIVLMVRLSLAALGSGAQPGRADPGARCKARAARRAWWWGVLRCKTFSRGPSARA